MSYAKKTFDPEFESYINIISSYGSASIKEVNSYVPIADNIRNFYWEGESKDSICSSITSIDNMCSGAILPETMQIIKKTKIVYEVLYPDLLSLRSLIELFNNMVDEINELESEIAHERARLAKGGGA